MRLGLRPQCNRGREEHLELSITYGSLKHTGDGSIIIRAWQGPQAHPQYNIPYVNSVVSKVFRHDGEQDLHFLQLRLINALSSKGFVDAKAGRKGRQLQLTTNCLIALLIQLSQNRPPRKGRYHQTQVYTQETVLPPQTLKAKFEISQAGLALPSQRSRQSSRDRRDGRVGAGLGKNLNIWLRCTLCIYWAHFGVEHQRFC